MSRRFDIAFAGFMMAGGLQIMAADGVEASLYPCVQVLVVPPFGPIAYLGDASRQPVTATALIGNGGILSDVGFSEGSESHQRFEINGGEDRASTANDAIKFATYVRDSVRS